MFLRGFPFSLLLPGFSLKYFFLLRQERAAPGSILCSPISLFFRTKKMYFCVINYLSTEEQKQAVREAGTLRKQKGKYRRMGV